MAEAYLQILSGIYFWVTGSPRPDPFLDPFLFHLIWTTKQRLPYITPDVQSPLYPYLGAITRNHSGKLLKIGGMSDHVHLE